MLEYYIRNEELCEHIYITKKALELWLHIVCVKTNMEKGLYSHLPLLDVAHLNYRM